MGWYKSEMNIWWNASSLFSILTRPFRRFFWWVIKSIQYSWFLRKDFDWDYIYILRLLQYKLKRTRKQILANDIIAQSDLVASQIKHAEDLIQNWIEGDWCSDLQEAHEKKWGARVMHNIDYDGSLLDCYGRANATTQDLIDQEKKEQMVIYDKMGIEEKENYDAFFSHIHKYFKEWWD